MYLTSDERTGVLLERIIDANNILAAYKGLPPYDAVVAAFNSIVAEAKRHPHWPKQAATKTPEPETEFREYEKPVAIPSEAFREMEPL